MRLIYVGYDPVVQPNIHSCTTFSFYFYIELLVLSCALFWQTNTSCEAVIPIVSILLVA